MYLPKKVVLCHEGLQVDGHLGLWIEDMRSLHVSGLGKRRKLGKTRNAFKYSHESATSRATTILQTPTFSTGPTD